ncbi:hypothetical protein [Salmonella enterica]|uniref:hypothetical protein n=1 Tax=Salmonella enterica TaxID=28901 RepID=UPI003EDC8984
MSRHDEPQDQPRIFMRHARKLGYCKNGSERLAERFGITFEQFLREGYPVAEALKSANPLLRKAAAVAQQEWDEAHAHGK